MKKAYAGSDPSSSVCLQKWIKDHLVILLDLERVLSLNEKNSLLTLPERVKNLFKTK